MGGLLVCFVAGGLVVVLAKQSRTAPQNASPSAAVSGLVRDQQTGVPIGGALVSLRSANGLERQLTDTKGRFVFARLQASDNYLLVASKPGYFDGGVGLRNPWQMTLPLAVRDREWLNQVKVSLTRTSSVSGRVTDERGRPMVAAKVRALWRLSVGGDIQLAAGPVTVTDDRGRYRIPDLDAGTYYIEVPSVLSTLPADEKTATLFRRMESRRQGPVELQVIGDSAGGSVLLLERALVAPLTADGRLQAYPITLHPGSRSLSDAEAVELAIGEDRADVDIAIGAVPTTRVSGVAVDPMGAAEGMTLRLLIPGLEGLGPGGEAATTRVGPGGSFVFQSVPIGEYVVDARRTVSEFAFGQKKSGSAIMFSATPTLVPGLSSSVLVTATQAGVRVDYSVYPGPSYHVNDRLIVDGQTVSPKTISLSSGATVKGQVGWDGKKGAADAVMAWPVGGDGFRPMASGAVTPAGAFEISGMAAGHYRLNVQGGGVLKALVCDGREISRGELQLSAGGALNCTVTLTLEAARLNGVVQHEPGQLASDVCVLVFPVEDDQWQRYGPDQTRIRSISTDPSGAFSIRDLPAGEYFVIALSGQEINAWRRPGFLKTIASRATRIRLEWATTSTINPKLLRRQNP